MAVLAMFALAATLACGSPTSSPPRTITRPIQVDSVEVLIQDAGPATSRPANTW